MPLSSRVHPAHHEPASVAVYPRVSVVIPALNEERNLPHVFERLPHGLHEVVLVDGHSVDGTVEVARSIRPQTRVVLQNRRGKGNALACGFAACTGDVIVMIDADGSTDPAEIPAFVAVLTGGADVAKGSRFTRGGGSHDITPLRHFGNSVLIIIVNRLFRTEFTDLCYGYAGFWRSCLPVFQLPVGVPGPRVWGDGFEIETVLSLRSAQAGIRVVEVPSVEQRRRHGESNLHTIRDGFRVLWTIGREHPLGRSILARRPRVIVLPETTPAATPESSPAAPAQAVRVGTRSP